MSISIETNLSLICSAFNISYAKVVNEYSGMTINEIMKAEAENGNDLASEFDEELLSSPDKLVEFIQLNNPSNKFVILSNLNQDDLNELVPFLEKEDMAMGLNFFTQDVLLEFVAQLPGEQAAALSLQMFNPEHLMSLMPKEAMQEVLNKDDIKKMRGLETECIKSLPPEIMAQMIEAATGEMPDGITDIDMAGNVSFDEEALMKQIQGFDKDTFQDSVMAIPERHMQLFMLSMIKEQPDIWGMFNPEYFAMIIGQKKQKEDIVGAASVVEKKQLVNMTEKLPTELMSVVLTQIDSKDFAKVLQKNFRDVLGELVVC